MLGEFSRDTWHVRWLPCKEIPILTDELDERAFLFVREVCPDGELLGGITGGEINLLCVLRRLEFHLFLYCRLLEHCIVFRVYMCFIELELLLGTSRLCHSYISLLALKCHLSEIFPRNWVFLTW